MNNYCERCSKGIPFSSLFCMFCGAQAPARTVSPAMLEQDGEAEGYYCPACGVRTYDRGLYCLKCGTQLFEKTTQVQIFCPSCGEKNHARSEFCYDCRFNLSEWFEMKGAAASKMGLHPEFILTNEKQEKIYHFIAGKEVSIGRTVGNTIRLNCQWVSTGHARFDTATFSLKDFGSTNCTYINGKTDKIDKVTLDSIFEFNIAGTFTFSVENRKGITFFQLRAIHSADACLDCGERINCKNMQGKYWIWITGDGKLLMRKEDGRISFRGEMQYRYLEFHFIDGNVYISDDDLAIDKRLVFPFGNFFESAYGLKILDSTAV